MPGKQPHKQFQIKSILVLKVFAFFLFLADFPIEIGNGEKDKGTPTPSPTPSSRSIRSMKETSEDPEESCGNLVSCEVIPLHAEKFSSDKPVHVQATVSHFNSTNSSFVQEAIATWVENVRLDQFTACFAKVGRGKRPSFAQTNFYWIAYQGAPDGGVSGQVIFPPFWSGTNCQKVILPPVRIHSN